MLLAAAEAAASKKLSTRHIKDIVVEVIYDISDMHATTQIVGLSYIFLTRIAPEKRKMQNI